MDSSFLLKVISMVLPKEKFLAVTALSSTYPKEELRFSRDFAKKLKVRHKIIKTEELNDKKFISNPSNRCYFCKKGLFSKLKALAKRYNLKVVLDASNVSDNKDYRPGNRAKRELGILSPLKEAGFNKEEISALSRRLGLNTWNKPNLACLASRVPYGIRITPRLLTRINKAEELLRSMGLRQARFRHYPDGLCRIEVHEESMGLLVRHRKSIIDRLRGMGYNYITMDLEGYRTGSLNLVLPAKNKKGV
jgi:uncharacterized protein